MQTWVPHATVCGKYGMGVLIVYHMANLMWPHHDLPTELQTNLAKQQCLQSSNTQAGELTCLYMMTWKIVKQVDGGGESDE